MLLATATVGPFKSIRNGQVVQIENGVTVLVGMNEAGKTVFLQALHKARDVEELARFDPVEDYPRRDLSAYLKKHQEDPETVVTLTYQLTEASIKTLNEKFHTQAPSDFTVSLTYQYDNEYSVNFDIDETPVVSQLAKAPGLSSDAQHALSKARKLREIPGALSDISLTETDKTFLAEIEKRIADAKWDSVVESEVWDWISARVPTFMYFGDYALLPSKMNLADLQQRVTPSSDPKQPKPSLSPEHRGVLALLRMADIAIQDFSKPGGYEPLKAKIEAVSISLTDQIMEFWKQNEDLEVEVDIKSDPEDQAPFNSGPNLYLRIKNRRHRGVSTPFSQRSKGFIWFFSFLVWFDSIQHQLARKSSQNGRDLILLLDEPGLSLHALAQADFLTYIDTLATKHQVIYTTHSPFMIHSEPERMKQIRTVEDKNGEGTVISADLQGSNSRTLFPLQAALGWTIAQNLFISKRNLLVEGPSELVYLKALSGILESQGRLGLRDDITLVPVGGLDKVATFVSLLGANGLDIAILHDYHGSPDQRLLDLIRNKIINSRAVMNVAQFVDLANLGRSIRSADIEDLFTVEEYLRWFSVAFSNALGGKAITESTLPPGERIVDRLERYLDGSGTKTRPTGGFNHYVVAASFLNNPGILDHGTLDRFEALFTAVNRLFELQAARGIERGA